MWCSQKKKGNFTIFFLNSDKVFLSTSGINEKHTLEILNSLAIIILLSSEFSIKYGIQIHFVSWVKTSSVLFNMLRLVEIVVPSFFHLLWLHLSVGKQTCGCKEPAILSQLMQMLFLDIVKNR